MMKTKKGKDMKKIALYTLAFAIVAIPSCHVETDDPDALDNLRTGPVELTVHAVMADNQETKTALQSDGTSVFWSPGDAINLFRGSKNTGSFTATNTSPAATTTFTGTLNIEEASSGDFWGIYPYDANNTCDGSSVTLTVPDTQEGKEESFAPGAFPSVAKSKNLQLSFYNVCGGIVFTVTNAGIKSVTVKGKGDEYLAGKVKVAFQDDTPRVTEVINGKKSVTLTAPNGGTFTPGKRYFIATLPVAFDSGFMMDFIRSDTEGSYVKTTSSTINRSRFRVVKNADESVDFVPKGNIVFADENVKAKLVAAFDTDGDGQLSYREAAAVTSDDDLKTAFGEDKGYETFDEFQFFIGITRIASNMFEGWSLSSIILPESIKRINPSAFKDCSVLESLIIPKGVNSIYSSAFYGCSSLTSITIPEGVTSISSHTFNGCSSLQSITIPNSLKTIGRCAFYECSSLTSISIPENVTTVADHAFYRCSSLTSVSIPKGVTTISGYTFESCSSLTSVIIPEGVETISTSAFFDCSSLPSVTIPDSVTGIYETAFSGCSSLTSIYVNAVAPPIGGIDMFANTNEAPIYVLVSSIEEYKVAENWSVYADRIQANPSDKIQFADEIVKKVCVGAFDTNQDGELSYEEAQAVTSIPSEFFGDYAGVIKSFDELKYFINLQRIDRRSFISCSFLKSISLPSSITYIGDSAFAGCSNLTTLTIPDGVKSIGNDAFEGCEGLTEIYLPDGVTSFGKYVFIRCSNLKSVHIPANLSDIPDYTFTNCTKLTDFNFPTNVSSIGTCAFKGCESIQSVVLPQSLVSLGPSAFAGCKALESVSIPSSIVKIKNGCFHDCSNLSTVDLKEGIVEIEDMAFMGCGNLKTIDLPKSLVSIGESCFRECVNLQSIDIPQGVVVIKNDTFYQCSALKSITLPDGLLSIDINAFGECSSLNSISLPNSLRKIGPVVFYGCTSLQSVIIPESIEQIEDNPFAGCFNIDSFSGKFVSEDGKAIIVEDVLIAIAPKGLTSYITPNGITKIGKQAFFNCVDLQSIDIQPGIVEIGYSAFSDCSNLSNVSLPEGVTIINEATFCRCTSLVSINLPSTLIEIGEFAFTSSAIRSLSVPKGIKTIGGCAFSHSSLREFYCPATTPPSLGGSAFYVSSATIYVPEGSLNEYKAATEWKKYASWIVGYSFTD